MVNYWTQQEEKEIEALMSRGYNFQRVAHSLISRGKSSRTFEAIRQHAAIMARRKEKGNASGGTDKRQ